MVDGGEGAGFLPEAGAAVWVRREGGGEGFDGDRPAEAGVEGVREVASAPVGQSP